MSAAQEVKEAFPHTPEESPPPVISWDIGTAYDFFMSLEVLHSPEEFGLRASWAAGVRSRLPAAERKLLEDIQDFLWVPMHWIYTLPEPKDASTAIWALRKVPPAQRPLVLMNPYKMDSKSVEILHRVHQRRAWDDRDFDELQVVCCEHKKKHLEKKLPAYLDWWAHPEEQGELYLSALQSYYQAFFAEEEKRIAPVLRDGLASAQEMAERMSLPELIAELSQGIHFDQTFDFSEIVLIPGYWNTPLIIFPMIGETRMGFLFGTRPAEMSLVPGEPVPDTLLRVLKSIADPTRLRILNYLSHDALTQAQLSRRLRLRAPTLTHHLKTLRLAGLVHVTLEPGGEKYYTSRLEAIQSTCDSLQEYLLSGSAESERA